MLKMLERQRIREENIKIKEEQLKNKELEAQKRRGEKEKERQEKLRLKEIERKNRLEKKQHKYETTFIGIKSSKILEFKKIENIYKVSVNFVSEIITCVKDKNLFR